MHIKKDNESFLEYAERLLDNRNKYDLDRAEIYELLYDKQVSSDHARKCLTNLQMTIDECKKGNVSEKIHKGFVDGDKEIEEELKKNYKETIELNRDGTQSSDKLIIMSQEDAKDPNFLLEAHGFSRLNWQLVSARNNIWNVHNKKDGILTLYSSKITVKPISEYIWNEDDVRKLFTKIKTEYKNKVTSPKMYEENGDVLVVAIADLHYGLLSSSYSTGNDYNLDIAEELFYYTLNDIIGRVKNKRFEKVLFIAGNDFVNFDSSSGCTTAGTPQDMASDWFDTVVKATQLIINGIDMLSEIAPVDVQYITSNHDLHTMFGIIQSIKAWYRNNDNVCITDDSPIPRKYYKIGKTLLCLTHDIKIRDALKIITTEAKDLWSESEHMICLLAHKHQAMQYEKQGYLEIYRLPTISGLSMWSVGKGFVQAEKKNQSFIINNKLGITDIINTIIL